ncbi:MAG: hypothetical protein RBT81_12550 [Gammaproteobacteria bacterium]|jgi:hypothetical protein|nr:hypothetical protein [Gammaproteobacteria bacterium]
MQLNTVTIADRIVDVAKARGLAMTNEGIIAYVEALAGSTPDEVWDAHVDHWRDVDSRTMPSPAALLERIKRARQARRAAQAASDADRRFEAPDDEQRFGAACFQIIRELGIRTLTIEQADQLMDNLARGTLGQDALNRYMRAAHEARP